MSKENEFNELDSLTLEDDFSADWDLGDDEDFIDIDLETGKNSESAPEEIFERPVRRVEGLADDPYADHQEMEDVTSGRYRRKTEDEERGGSRNRRSGSHFSGGKSYIVLILLCLAIVAAIVVVLKLAAEKAPGAADTTASTETAAETTPAAVWQKSAVPAVDELVNQYYTARANADMTTLLNVLDSSVMVDETRIQAEAQVISEYQNIECYTTEGMKDGEYVVYIAFNMKFKDIPTAAPGLVPAYARPDAAGTLKLVTWDTAKVDPELSSFMGTAADCEMIRSLAESVNSAYQTAYNNDAQLASFLDSLNNAAAQPTTAADPGAETQADPNAETQADPNAETQADPGAETQADPNAETQADPNAETQADPNAETQAETTTAEPTTSAEFTELDSMEYATEDVKCRTAPNTDEGTDFVMVKGGDRVHVIGTNGVWYHVYLSDGTEGYIRADFVTPDAPSQAE